MILKISHRLFMCGAMKIKKTPADQHFETHRKKRKKTLFLKEQQRLLLFVKFISNKTQQQDNLSAAEELKGGQNE